MSIAKNMAEKMVVDFLEKMKTEKRENRKNSEKMKKDGHKTPIQIPVQDHKMTSLL